MWRIFFWVFLAYMLILKTVAAAEIPIVDKVNKMSAAQIVEKNVAARGGLPAWRTVNTLTLSGRIEAGGTQNQTLPFKMLMKRPHMNRLEINLQGKTAVQVYDGEHGWKVRPFLGRNEIESFTSAEAKAANEWQELDGPLVDYLKKGSKVKLLGTTSVDGHSAYKLRLTMKNGVERRIWVDTSSFLELKADGEPRILDGKLRNVTISYRDYRKENGLIMPHVVETLVDGGKQPHSMFIEHVEVNQAMADELFAKPQQLAVAQPSGQMIK